MESCDGCNPQVIERLASIEAVLYRELGNGREGQLVQDCTSNSRELDSHGRRLSTVEGKLGFIYKVSWLVLAACITLVGEAIHKIINGYLS